ncbi:hypothetical protein HJFPF1_09115 [Paramyrothecium foliicola]|nr:hypothetical protein HJFPF1_09115 [Paramyrothecium foliicola]
MPPNATSIRAAGALASACGEASVAAQEPLRKASEAFPHSPCPARELLRGSTETSAGPLPQAKASKPLARVLSTSLPFRFKLYNEWGIWFLGLSGLGWEDPCNSQRLV